jgi:anti-sigma factor ChrR (cupin superfamily)
MLLAILGLLPAVPHIIISVEHMMGHGSGPAKKQAATSMIGDLVNSFSQMSSGTVPGANSPIMAFVDTLIEATVELFNNDGTFVHGPTAK